MHRKSKRYDFVHTIGAIVGPKLAIVPLHAVRDAGVAAMTWGKSEHPDDWASTLCMFGEIVVRNTECDIAAIKPDCNGRFLEHFSLPRNEPIRDGERLVFINREDRAFPAEVLDASNQRNVKVVVEPEVVRGGGVFVRPNGKLVGIPLRYGIKCQRFWSWFISTETALECLE
jgi:hypothetical protein